MFDQGSSFEHCYVGNAIVNMDQHLVPTDRSSFTFFSSPPFKLLTVERDWAIIKDRLNGLAGSLPVGLLGSFSTATSPTYSTHHSS